MKFQNIFKITALSLLMISIGCGKEFLETNPTNIISSEDFTSSADINPALVDGSLRGIYSSLINTGTGGTSSHEDFGQKGYDIYSDLLTSDMALSSGSYNRFVSFASYQTTTDNTRTENYMPWRYYYRIIRSANVFLDNIGTPSNTDQEYAVGQAKALRAYAYFYLSQFFITEYDPASKVLPLLTSSDQIAEPQSTTEEIYNQIITDLTESIQLLDGFVRSNKNQINKDVAKALLAYTYGAMGTSSALQNAKTLTSEIISSSSYTLMDESEIVGGFNDINTSNWMWGFDLTLDMGFDLISWWGMMDIFSYSYQWAGNTKVMDQDLYNAIPSDDIRKSQFLDNSASGYHLSPYNKFYHSDRVIGGQRNIETDYVFMRVAEMYLLHAEVSAKTGDEASAKNSLKQLLDLRLPDTSYVDGLTGQALLDEIYFQTRIELWGEGKTYLALKRNKKSTKRGDNHLSNLGVEIQYNDPRLTWTIPLSEIQNNPHIN